MACLTSPVPSVGLLGTTHASFSAGKSFFDDSTSPTFNECCHHESSPCDFILATAEKHVQRHQNDAEETTMRKTKGGKLCDTPDMKMVRGRGRGGHLSLSAARALLFTPSSSRNNHISTLLCRTGGTSTMAYVMRRQRARFGMW